MITIVDQAILAAQLEDLIDSKAKISRVANRKYEDMFKGNATTEVTIRNFGNVETTHGEATDAGNTIAETDLTQGSESFVLSELDTFNVKVKKANQIINDYDQKDRLLSRIAHRTSMNHDSFVASLVAKNAGTTLYNQSPATLTASTVEQLYSDIQVALSNGDVEETDQAIFINPAVLGLTNRAPMRTGFDESLKFKEVFNAGTLSGLACAKTTNLPVKYTLTIGAAATATDTIKIRVPNARKLSEEISPAYDEVTFTAKATPSAAGEFNVAANAGAQQTIIKDMINGTGTPGATSYIALSAADRKVLQRGFVNCETFGDITTNKAGITARAGVTVVVSLTAAGNVISSISNLLLALDPKAVHFAELMHELKIVDGSTNNQSFADNVMFENVYGGKVTNTNKVRIVIAEVTN